MMKYYISSTLEHHGVVGQKWGVRRYQNEDGSLTAAGKERYGVSEKRDKKANKIERRVNKQIYRSEKSDANLLNKREKYRSKRVSKFDAKIEKLKQKTDDRSKISKLENQKSNFTRDFDSYTKNLKRGMDKYNKILKNYRDAKIDVLYNGKSPESRVAIENYVAQKLNDSYYGKGASKTFYMADYAREQRKQTQSKLLD